MADRIGAAEGIDEESLNRVVKAAVKQAFREIGLHDEAAEKDIGDLRSLLAAWRSTKSLVLQSVIKWMTVAILGLVALSVWERMGK